MPRPPPRALRAPPPPRPQRPRWWRRGRNLGRGHRGGRLVRGAGSDEHGHRVGAVQVRRGEDGCAAVAAERGARQQRHLAAAAEGQNTVWPDARVARLGLEGRLEQTLVKDRTDADEQYPEQDQPVQDADDGADDGVGDEAQQVRASEVENRGQYGLAEAAEVPVGEAVVALAEPRELRAGDAGRGAQHQRLDEPFENQQGEPRSPVVARREASGDERPVLDQRVAGRVRHAGDDAERQSVHEVVELRTAREEDRACLADDLTDDGREHRGDEEAEERGTTDTCGDLYDGVVAAQGDPDQRPADPQRQGEHEGGTGDGDGLVLPEVHVVEVDDVDHRHGKGRDHHSDRYSPHDGGQRHEGERDLQGQTVCVRPSGHPSRHDRRDQGERGHRLVRLEGERRLPAPVLADEVVATDMAEVRDLGQGGVATRTLHVSTFRLSPGPFMAHAQRGVSRGRAEGVRPLSGRFFGADVRSLTEGHQALPEPVHLILEIVRGS